MTRSRLTQREAAHIRASIAAGSVTTRQAAKAYGVCVETIRRIVRGDTHASLDRDEYGRVREADELPRIHPATQLDAAESLKKVMKMMEEEREEKKESALERFMRETASAKAASPDALVEELKTAAPTDSGEQAGNARE